MSCCPRWCTPKGPSFFFVSFLAVLSCAEIGIAQLDVLSSGDPKDKWREAQIDLLSTQLEDESIRGALRQELEAQVKWLTNWQPNELNLEPLWGTDDTRPLMSEPTVDPAKTATRLRQRLLGPQARPTARDTQQLQKLLLAEPDDVGVRQLHLHWIDQLQYRKQYADEIAEAAMKLHGLLTQIQPQTEQTKWARAYAMYRRGRALAYRELPDVIKERPIEDEQAHESQLLGAYAQLVDIVGTNRTEFILLEIRMLRRDHWYGRALGLLEERGKSIDKKWFLKKRRDLLKELGWDQPQAESAAIYAREFPEAVAAESKSN